MAHSRGDQMQVVRSVPVTDTRFREDVDAIVGELAEGVAMTARRLDDALPGLLDVLRVTYPGVWARWQEPLAIDGDGRVLYVFRDPKPPREQPPRMPRLPPERRRR